MEEKEREEGSGLGESERGKATEREFATTLLIADDREKRSNKNREKE